LGNSIRALVPGFPDHEFIFTDVEDLNITDSGQLENYFSKESINVCINCAGYTAVDRAEKERDLAFKLNRDAVGLLRKVTRKHKSYLIHISTDYVFNGQNWNPYFELDDTTAASVYGQSKAAGEKELLECDKCMIIRTSWLYSEYGKNFFKTMIDLMQTRSQLTVVNDQVGTPTYAGDLAKAILKIITEINNDNFVPGIFHFSNEGVASWYDFAWEIARISGSVCLIDPVETHEYPLPAPRPAYSVLNKSRIKKVYGVSIPYWRESLQECYEKYKIIKSKNLQND